VDGSAESDTFPLESACTGTEETRFMYSTGVAQGSVEESALRVPSSGTHTHYYIFQQGSPRSPHRLVLKIHQRASNRLFFHGRTPSMLPRSLPKSFSTQTPSAPTGRWPSRPTASAKMDGSWRTGCPRAAATGRTSTCCGFRTEWKSRTS
jgi:hypothetical protein